MTGNARQPGSAADGTAQVDIAAQIHVAGPPALLDLRLFGRPLPGGGLEMASSSVSLGPSGQPRLYRGRVVALSGNRVVARLTSSGARSVLLRLLLQIDASGAVTGSASAQETSG